MRIQLLIDFIPIILVYLFVVHPKESVLFSHTSLGKLIAISLILLYGSYKYVYGLFVCVLVIFYYQTNIVSDIVTAHFIEKRYGSIEGMEIQTEMPEAEDVSDTGAETPSVDSVSEIPMEQSEIQDVPVELEAKEPQPQIQAQYGYGTVEDTFIRPFQKYEPNLNAYEPSVPFNEQNEDILNGVDKKAQLKQIFRQQYCDNGHLKMKGEKVKTEMAQHVFSGLENTNGCNPCDEDCDFSILEEKLRTEQELVTPKDSNDWIEIANEAFSNISTIPAYFSQYIPNWNIAAYT
jgi:hypothetical protein